MNTRQRSCLLTTLLLVACLLPSHELLAHPMAKSAVLLDFRGHVVGAELRLPIERFEVAFGRRMSADPRSAIATYHAELVAYVASHISAVGSEGQSWRVDVVNVRGSEEAMPSEVVVQVRLTAPPGDAARQLTLHYDVIARELKTEKTLVSLRSDWDAGEMSGPPLMLGELGSGTTSLVVDRPHGSQWAGVASVFSLGVRHIAEGTDHLLFLLALLLPAPLIAARGKWAGYGGSRRGAQRLLYIVTAFTAGHSLTLAAAATGMLRVPSGPVEVLIAISILVSAIHAIRPLFPGREAWVAGAFGLVHGLAFATMIAGYGIDPWHTVLTVIAFNLGIEMMQLVVVLLTVPWLLSLARTSAYSFVRVSGAAFAAAAALGWIGERAFGLANPIGPLVERAADHALVVAIALPALSVLAHVWQRRQRVATDARGNVRRA